MNRVRLASTLLTLALLFSNQPGAWAMGNIPAPSMPEHFKAAVSATSVWGYWKPVDGVNMTLSMDGKVLTTVSGSAGTAVADATVDVTKAHAFTLVANNYFRSSEPAMFTVPPLLPNSVKVSEAIYNNSSESATYKLVYSGNAGQREKVLMLPSQASSYVWDYLPASSSTTVNASISFYPSGAQAHCSGSGVTGSFNMLMRINGTKGNGFSCAIQVSKN